MSEEQGSRIPTGIMFKLGYPVKLANPIEVNIEGQILECHKEKTEEGSPVEPRMIVDEIHVTRISVASPWKGSALGVTEFIEKDLEKAAARVAERNQTIPRARSPLFDLGSMASMRAARRILNVGLQKVQVADKSIRKIILVTDEYMKGEDLEGELTSDGFRREGAKLRQIAIALDGLADELDPEGKRKS